MTAGPTQALKSTFQTVVSPGNLFCAGDFAALEPSRPAPVEMGGWGISEQ